MMKGFINYEKDEKKNNKCGDCHVLPRSLSSLNYKYRTWYCPVYSQEIAKTKPETHTFEFQMVKIAERCERCKASELPLSEDDLYDIITNLSHIPGCMGRYHEDEEELREEIQNLKTKLRKLAKIISAEVEEE